MDVLATSWVAYVSIAMVAIGSGAFVWNVIGDPDSFLREGWAQYIAALNREIRLQFLKQKAENIAMGQLFLIAITCAVGIAISEPFVFLFVPLIAVLPMVRLKSQGRARIERLEEQLDGWLVLLSNAIRATPAIGEALAQTVALVHEPLRQDLDLVVKENQLGTPLDEALLNMADRVDSPTVGGAVAMLVVSRQTGGNISEILETSAESLREMARLEGVVRTKTAEGRGQLVVLGAMPIVMGIALSLLDPTWWPTLSGSFAGQLVLGVSAIVWAIAIMWGRAIVDVDI